MMSKDVECPYCGEWQEIQQDDGCGCSKCRESIKRNLTCTLCNKQQETHAEIVYSTGTRVCVECKKGTQRADNAQFDLDMSRRKIAGFQ